MTKFYTANELYTAQPVKTTGGKWDWDLVSILENVLDNFQLYDYDFPMDTGQPCKIEAKILFFHSFDGERIMELGSLWFQGKPFAIFQLAGRGGKDHEVLYVTDRDVYLSFRSYLENFKSIWVAPNIVDPNRRLPDYTAFYGHNCDEDLKV
jgi:hypothetical protein